MDGLIAFESTFEIKPCSFYFDIKFLFFDRLARVKSARDLAMNIQFRASFHVAIDKLQVQRVGWLARQMEIDESQHTRQNNSQCVRDL